MRFFQAIGRWFATLGMNPADYINAGNAQYLKQDYEGAIADYTEAIRIDPTHVGALTNRGTAWYCKQQYDHAIADYSRAIDLDPNFLYAYEGRGRARLAKLEFDYAIADFTAALEIDPRDANSYAHRGTAWYYKQDLERALADYNDAIRYDPNLAYAFSGRGSTWVARQERDRTAHGAYQLDRPTLRGDARSGYDRALDDFYEAIRLDPNDAFAFCGRGATWACLEDYAKAIADFGEAIRIEPTFVHAYVSRGEAFREQQAYRSAIADFEAAMRLAPGYAWAVNGLAWLLGSALDAEVRDGKRAVELAKQALALDPSFPAAWLDTLAVAHAECGNFAEAVHCQEQALQTAPPAFEAEMRERLELYRKQQPYRQQKKRLAVTQFMPAKVR
jgi:tetratricopeptide (TPR) repeat protein